MPNKPRQACPICRRLNCTDPAHERARTPFASLGRQRVLARPDYRDAAQVRRRRETVEAFMAEHGVPAADGTVIARCPECGKMRAYFAADHAVPFAQGGDEHGLLRVHCRSCSARQGARIANERRRERDGGM